MNTSSPTLPFPSRATAAPTRRVIDAPMRMFHWLFALCFVGAYASADGEHWRMLHVTLGYTLAGLLLFAAAPIALNQALGIKTPYDVQKDLAPISLVASGGVLVLVHPSTPYKTMQDIVQAAKANPAGLIYATAGVGSMPHLIGEGWKVRSGANLVHVGYKGSAGAMQDAVAGTVTVLSSMLGAGLLTADKVLSLIHI